MIESQVSDHAQQGDEYLRGFWQVETRQYRTLM
jgi:hypothetical protein